MNYTERQLHAFRENFSQMQRRRRITQAISFAAWIFIGMGIIFRGRTAFGIPAEVLPGLFVPVFFGATVYYMFMWKCPACRTRLGQQKVKFCATCGLPLED